MSSGPPTLTLSRGGLLSTLQLLQLHQLRLQPCPVALSGGTGSPRPACPWCGRPRAAVEQRVWGGPAWIRPADTRAELGRREGWRIRGHVVVLINESFSVLSSYLRTMTALLDPTQIEERERRRLKQLEQQVVGGGRGGVRNTGREAAFLNTPPTHLLYCLPASYRSPDGGASSAERARQGEEERGGGGGRQEGGAGEGEAAEAVQTGHVEGKAEGQRATGALIPYTRGFLHTGTELFPAFVPRSSQVDRQTSQRESRRCCRRRRPAVSGAGNICDEYLSKSETGSKESVFVCVCVCSSYWTG